MCDVKSIFALRREGRIDEALKQVRYMYRLNTSDEWTIKAYGWCLISKISSASHNSELLQLRNELRRLKISRQDDLLFFSVQKALNPYLEKIKEAGSLSKENGSHWQARNILSDILKRDPDNQDALNTLGWVCYRLLADKNTANKNDILVELTHIFPKITEKNPLLIRQLARVTSNAPNSFENYPEFFKTGLLPNLTDNPRRLLYRDELYSPEKTANNKSLEEIALKGMYRHLKKFPQNRISVSGWLGELLLNWKNASWDDQTWGAYYLGRLLTWCSDNNELALSTLLPVARMKKDEFWIWEAIADCMKSDELKLACYCRSLTCHVPEEQYLVKIYYELAKLWFNERKYPEASYATGQILKWSSDDFYKLPGYLVIITKSDWYNPGELSKEKFLQKTRAISQKTDEILYQDLPVISANFISEYYNSDNKNYYTDFVLEDGNICFLKLSESINLKPGDCADVKIQTHLNKQKVVWWKKRVNQSWDLVGFQKAIIVHTDHKKGFLLAAISEDDSTIMHFDKFPEVKKFEIGDIIEARIIKIDQDKYKTIDWVKKIDDHYPDFIKPFEGDFNFADGHSFGFADADFGSIFISPTYTKNLKDGESIKGIATYQKKPNHYQYGWKAVKIEKNQNLKLT
ncbi:MAG: hypothetical protein JXQ65_05840 [Candidatus Marinimicrobia bacterium]|nr:hypothetical protein [Candidatus Neomarinimicrobiota bacterium]